MQISKTQVIKSVVFCIVLALCVMAINFVLVPYSSMNRRFRGYRTEMEKGNIDIMVIGSSHEFDGFDAEKMSELTGLHTCVFAPQGGNPETSYYCLLDAAGKNKIKKAVLGWDLLDNFESPYYTYPSNRRAQMYRELLKDSNGNSELLKTTITKMLDQRYTMTLFEYASFPENISEIKATIDSRKLIKEPWKQTEFTSDTPIDVTDIYKSKYSLNELLSKNYKNEVNPDTVEWIKKTKKLCDEKGIELYYVCGPYPKEVYELVPETKEYYETTRKIFSDLEINFIDTEDESYFPNIHETTKFHDFYGHFVIPGKIEYTTDVCNWIKDKENK